MANLNSVSVSTPMNGDSKYPLGGGITGVFSEMMCVKHGSVQNGTSSSQYMVLIVTVCYELQRKRVLPWWLRG